MIPVNSVEMYEVIADFGRGIQSGPESTPSIRHQSNVELNLVGGSTLVLLMYRKRIRG